MLHRAGCAQGMGAPVCASGANTSTLLGVVRCCGGPRCLSICRPSEAPARGASPKFSRFPRTCINSMAATLHEAEAECAAHGRRLCTASEYASSCCRSGCQMDLMAAWVQGAHGCVTPTRPAPNVCPFACAAGTGDGGAASSSASGGERGAKQIAVCAVGQVRGFTLPFVYRSSYQTFLAPVRDMADVFFAIDAWSAGTEGVGTFDEYPNRTAALPAELLRLFAPVAIEWGHAERRCCTASCEGHNCVSRAAMRRTPPDARCAGHAPISFGQTFSMWRARQLITHYEQAGRRGAAYRGWCASARQPARPPAAPRTGPSIDRPVLRRGRRAPCALVPALLRPRVLPDGRSLLRRHGSGARLHADHLQRHHVGRLFMKAPAHPGCDKRSRLAACAPRKSRRLWPPTTSACARLARLEPWCAWGIRRARQRHTRHRRGATARGAGWRRPPTTSQHSASARWRTPTAPSSWRRPLFPDIGVIATLDADAAGWCGTWERPPGC